MKLLTQNVDFGPASKISPWRQAALALWRTAGDPSIYGVIEFDVEPALAYLAEQSERSGIRLTLTHFVGKALAEALKRDPELNSMLRLGRIYPRRGVSICFTVASDAAGRDLGIYTLRKADEKSLLDIGREMAGGIREVKQKNDPKHQTFKKLISFFPTFLARPLVSLASGILYGLNLWSPISGLPRDAFGAALVTNVGSLGLDLTLGALIPATRIPLVVSVGAVQDLPMVQNGQVVARKGFRMGVTIDHRVIDAVPAARMSETLKKVFANPEAELETV